MKKKKSLLRSILYSSSGVLIIVIALVCILFATAVNTNMFTTKKSEVYYRVAEQSSDMNAWMTKHIALAEDLALTARVGGLRGEDRRTYLRDCMLEVSPSIMDCYVSWVDESPFMICAVFVPADDYVPESRGWYKKAVAANGTTITDPYIDAFTGKIVITVASLVKDENGRTIGCCGLDIDISELVSITDNMHADENGYAILLDASDNVVVDARHPDNSHYLADEGVEKYTALHDLSPTFAEVLNAGSSTVIEGRDLDGMRSFFPIVELGDTGWKLLYVADYNEAHSAVTFYTLLVIAIGLTGIVGGSVFFYIKTTRRLKPLRALETVVGEMKAGLLTHDYPDTVNDEVGAICSALRETNEALKSYVGDISCNLSRMAGGDFRVRFEADYVGEFTSIRTSLDQISTAMTDILKGVGAASDRVNSSAGSVSGTASLLAEGAQEQTRTVEQLTGIVQNLVEQINENSESAGRADSSAKLSVGTIDTGSGQMKKLVSSMDHISELSGQIEKIIKTIDDIAFQTNILALNASVEAARAGAAGKGFAVVADEVRNLAQKSAEAAQGTANLIEDTLSAIEESTQLAHGAARSLEGIAAAASEVSRLVECINQTSSQQNQEAVRIQSSLNELGGIATRNAGTAQESAAASEDLTRQAQTLNDLLRKLQK